MKLNDFLADLCDTFTAPTRVTIVKGILAALVILLCALALTILLMQISPTIERFSQYGYLGIFLVTFFSSLSILFPVPGLVLWLSLVVSMHLNPAWAALVASIGGTLGEVSSYYVGYAGRAVIAPKYSQRYQTAERWMKRYGGVAIFVFAFLWILPFDLIGIAAGVLKYSIERFLLFCWLGRLPRSLIECYIYCYTGTALFDFLSPYLPGI